MIATYLSGGWPTATAAIPHPEACGNGGSIILTSDGVAVRFMWFVVIGMLLRL